MSRQDVSCFITTTHHDNDDDDEFVVESSDRVESNPRGWLDGDIVNPLPHYFKKSTLQQTNKHTIPSNSFKL